MNKVLFFLLLLVCSASARAQFSHPVISLDLNLKDYSGRFDTTRQSGEVSTGSATGVGMNVSLSTSDTALGVAGGLAADYGWFSHLDGGTRFNQLSISVDTMKGEFSSVTVAQHDTTNGPAMDASLVSERSVRFVNVPFQMTAPGVFIATLTGTALDSHIDQPYAEQRTRFFRLVPGDVYDFVADPDSTANASLTMTVRFPTAGVARDVAAAAPSVWPIPAATALHVDGIGIAECSVLDVLGRTVQSGSAPVLDIERLPVGVYYLETSGRLSSFVISR